jgi:hypothetical protein
VFASDPADLFGQLYDILPERLFAQYGDAEEWLSSDAVADIAADIEHQAVLYGRISAELLERYIDPDGDPEDDARNRFAVLLGLDRAFLQVDMASGTSDTGGLTEHVLRWIETGRLDSGTTPGAVLPKVAVPGQAHLLPETMRDAFSSLIRVPSATPLPVVHEPLDDWPSRTVRENGLRVAVLPAFGSADPFLVERREAPVPSYRLRLEDPEDPDVWVADRIRALDESGAQVAVLPEMAVTPVVRDAWRRQCEATPRPPGGQLWVIVIGSGPERDDARPHNRAVILDRQSGAVLWEQDKLHRFQLEDEVIRRWGLQDRLGEGPLEEWCSTGQEIVIREAPGLRLAVLVCEDLTQLATVGATVSMWGISLCLCPIFAQGIRRFRWEHQHAAWLEQNAGVQTVVSNSMLIGDAEPEFGDRAGTALALAPATLIEAGHPLDVRVVRFTDLGVVTLV